MDISEQNARAKGDAKNWSEEKIQRRAGMRRNVRVFFTRTVPKAARDIASVVFTAVVRKGVDALFPRNKQ